MKTWSHQGRELNINQLLELATNGIIKQALRYRLDKGWPTESALTDRCFTRSESGKIGAHAANSKSPEILAAIRRGRFGKNNSSGYPGVSFAKKQRRWRAGIMINGKFIHVGYYTTAHKAGAAYWQFSIILKQRQASGAPIDARSIRAELKRLAD